MKPAPFLKILDKMFEEIPLALILFYSEKLMNCDSHNLDVFSIKAVESK